MFARTCVARAFATPPNRSAVRHGAPSHPLRAHGARARLPGGGLGGGEEAEASHGAWRGSRNGCASDSPLRPLATPGDAQGESRRAAACRALTAARAGLLRHLHRWRGGGPVRSPHPCAVPPVLALTRPQHHHGPVRRRCAEDGRELPRPVHWREGHRRVRKHASRPAPHPRAQARRASRCTTRAPFSTA